MTLLPEKDTAYLQDFWQDTHQSERKRKNIDQMNE